MPIYGLWKLHEIYGLRFHHLCDAIVEVILFMRFDAIAIPDSNSVSMPLGQTV